MTATASYRLARIAGGFRLSLSVHITKKDWPKPTLAALRFKESLFYLRANHSAARYYLVLFDIDVL